jgi:hypothetical protein
MGRSGLNGQRGLWAAVYARPGPMPRTNSCAGRTRQGHAGQRTVAAAPRCPRAVDPRIASEVDAGIPARGSVSTRHETTRVPRERRPGPGPLVRAAGARRNRLRQPVRRHVARRLVGCGRPGVGVLRPRRSDRRPPERGLSHMAAVRASVRELRVARRVLPAGVDELRDLPARARTRPQRLLRHEDQHLPASGRDARSPSRWDRSFRSCRPSR